MKSSAPTTVGIVTWSTTAPGITSAEIDFGLDTTYGMVAPVDLARTDYRTVLVGMKPEKTYHFRVVASDGTTTYASEDHLLATGARNTASPIVSFSVSDAASWRGVSSSPRSGTGRTPRCPSSSTRTGTSCGGTSLDPVSRPMESPRPRYRRTARAFGSSTKSLPGRRCAGSPSTVSRPDLREHERVPRRRRRRRRHDALPRLQRGKSACNPVSRSTAPAPRSWCGLRPIRRSCRNLPLLHGNALRYSLKGDEITYSDLLQDVVVLDRAET